MNEEDVREEATPETNVEATEQREDDYQGLSRRINEVIDVLARVEGKIDAIIASREIAAATFVEDGGAINDAEEKAEEIVEEYIDRVLDIDALDLM